MVIKRMQLIDAIVGGRKLLNMYDAEAEAFVEEIIAIQDHLDLTIELEMCKERCRVAEENEEEARALLLAAKNGTSQGQDLQDTTQTTLAQLASEERE